MVRKRIEPELALKSWDDVDKVLKEILELEVQAEKLDGEMSVKIAKTKETYKGKIDPLKNVIKLKEKEVQEFVEENRDDMNGRKTKVLTHGNVGFRKSSKLSIPTKMVATIIQKLRLRKMDNCINVKETINKDELKKYPLEVIVELGCSIKQDDAFGYELNRDSIPD